MKEICVLCRLSPSELVEEWIAHVTSVGCNQEPTLSTLGEFERKVSVMLNTPYILVFNGVLWKSCQRTLQKSTLNAKSGRRQKHDLSLQNLSGPFLRKTVRV